MQLFCCILLIFTSSVILYLLCSSFVDVPTTTLANYCIIQCSFRKDNEKKRIATGYQIIQLVEIVCFDFKLFTIKTFVVERVI